MVKILILLFWGTVFSLAGNDGTPRLQGRFWLIRHGQRDTVKAPDFDPPLTADGVRQAELAAKYLKKMGFKGRIYASPYRRTMETASIIARELGKPVYTAAFLQEFVRFPGVHPVREKSIQSLKKEFPLLAEQAVLPRNWPIRSKENLNDVRDRLYAGLKMLDLPEEKEVLLVTHGAVLKAAHMLASGCSSDTKWKKMNWNCCISSYEFSFPAPAVVKLFFEVGFLPQELISSNERYMVKK